jgi:hypothetical protein
MSLENTNTNILNKTPQNWIQGIKGILLWDGTDQHM